jgi:hypothetical protein
MLNDADGHGGGNTGSGEVKDAAALFTRLKSQVSERVNAVEASCEVGRDVAEPADGASLPFVKNK